MSGTADPDPVAGGPTAVVATHHNHQQVINQLIDCSISLFFIVFRFVVGKRLLEGIGQGKNTVRQQETASWSLYSARRKRHK
jgi:hypothetical protein